jgi:hypothetical protein
MSVLEWGAFKVDLQSLVEAGRRMRAGLEQ